MSLWTLTRPPRFKNPGGKDLIATDRGWTDPDTGEVLVAISNLDSKNGAATIASVSFGAASYIQGAPLSIRVRFTEKVNVTVGASIVVSSNGVSGNFSVNAAAQNGVVEVVFNKQANNTSQFLVPAEAGTLSIAGQTLSGTVQDTAQVIASSLVLSNPVAALAGTRVIA